VQNVPINPEAHGCASVVKRMDARERPPSIRDKLMPAMAATVGPLGDDRL